MNISEKIKKGLECCARMAGCVGCPYRGEKCVLTVSVDALAYIQQLEERECTLSHDAVTALINELEKIKRERDAAVEDLRAHCGVCVHVRDCLVTGCSGDMGEACKQCPCLTCINYNNWQWRGVKEVSDEQE